MTGKLAILAGRGAMPKALAEAYPDAVCVTFDGVETPVPRVDAHHRFEAFGALLDDLKERGVERLVLAGGVGRPPLDPQSFDPFMQSLAPRLLAALQGGDDALVRLVVSIFEEAGFTVIGAHELLPDLVAPEGQLSKAKPSTAERRNIAAAMEAARAIGALDIGQAAVAVRGRVVALEGAEGTAEMIERVHRLRSAGRIGKAGGGLVKCAKPNQELRADLPAIGPDTVRSVHAAGLAGIAVEAGRAIMLHRKELVEIADELGIFVTGVPGGKS